MLLYIKAKQFQIELYYEDGTKEIINEDIQRYLSWLCECYASTLEGRKRIVCDLLQIKQLPPIVVKDDLSLILFVCKDKNSNDYYYLNYETVIDIKASNEESKIVFVNGQTQCIPCSTRSLKKQRDRCWQLKNSLRYRQASNHLKKL